MALKPPTPDFAVVEITVKVKYVVRHAAVPEDLRNLEGRIASMFNDAPPMYGLTTSPAVVTSKRKALRS